MNTSWCLSRTWKNIKRGSSHQSWTSPSGWRSFTPRFFLCSFKSQKKHLALMLQSLLFRIYIPGIIGVECDISYKSIFWFFYFQLKTCVIFHTNQKQEVNVKFCTNLIRITHQGQVNWMSRSKSWAKRRKIMWRRLRWACCACSM